MLKKIQTPVYLIVLIAMSILINGCSGGGKGATAVDLSKTTVCDAFRQ
jgi:serine kinase of HPr protein (carbohydrate metabolism regulator)